MKRKNKYAYLRVIQFSCGYGWEDVEMYDKAEQGWEQAYRHDLKEYRLSNTGSYRAIDRRVLNEN